MANREDRFSRRKCLAHSTLHLLKNAGVNWTTIFPRSLAIPDVADFKKHFSSQDLKIFIDYDANKDMKAKRREGFWWQKKRQGSNSEVWQEQ